MRIPSPKSDWSFTSRIAVLIAGLLLIPATTLQLAADDLPSAEVLLDKHVAATGGEESHLAIKNRVTTGKLVYDIGGHKLEGNITISQQLGNYHMRLESEVLSMIRATNGSEVWEWRAASSHGDESASLLTGPEKDRTIELAQLHSAVHWRKRFKTVKTVGVSMVDDKPAFEVQVTNQQDETWSRFFDQESGRLVKIVRKTLSSQLGEIDTEVFFRDYRQVDGVWLPMSVDHKMDIPGVGAGSQSFTYSKITHEEKIPSSLFDIPAELSNE